MFRRLAQRLQAGSAKVPPPDVWHELFDKQALEVVYLDRGGPK